MPRQAKPDSLIPRDVDHIELKAGRNIVTLTNLRKPFWPELGISKGDVLCPPC